MSSLPRPLQSAYGPFSISDQHGGAAIWSGVPVVPSLLLRAGSHKRPLFWFHHPKSSLISRERQNVPRVLPHPQSCSDFLDLDELALLLTALELHVDADVETMPPLCVLPLCRQTPPTGVTAYNYMSSSSSSSCNLGTSTGSRQSLCVSHRSLVAEWTLLQDSRGRMAISPDGLPVSISLA